MKVKPATRNASSARRLVVPKKNRVPIPEDVSAELLFLHDHTCCVCREKGKSVQIHHINEDPSNNAMENLTVFAYRIMTTHRSLEVLGGGSLPAKFASIVMIGWNG
jgi:hypothetical protein